MIAPDKTRRELRRTPLLRTLVNRYCLRLLLGLRLCRTVRHGGAHLADSRDPTQPVHQRKQIVVPTALPKTSFAPSPHRQRIPPEAFDPSVFVKNLCII